MDKCFGSRGELTDSLCDLVDALRSVADKKHRCHTVLTQLGNAMVKCELEDLSLVRKKVALCALLVVSSSSSSCCC